MTNRLLESQSGLEVERAYNYGARAEPELSQWSLRDNGPEPTFSPAQTGSKLV